MNEDIEHQARQWIAERKRLVAARSRLINTEGIYVSLKPSTVNPEYLDDPLRSAVMTQLHVDNNDKRPTPAPLTWALSTPEIKVSWDKVVKRGEE